MIKRYICMIALLLVLCMGSAMATSADGASLQLPSKSAADMIQVSTIVDADGNALPEDFQIVVVEETQVVSDELANIREYLAAEDAATEVPLITYFPEEVQTSVGELMDPELDLTTLVAYEYVPLTMENYDLTYGDVVAPFTFATPYEPGQQVVALLGISQEDVEEPVLWNVLPATVNENAEVEIVFSQENLAAMENKTALLIVMSEPFAEE